MADKPFCFRCGGEPRYQLSLRMQGDDGVWRDGPFWPLCLKCFLWFPWARVLVKTVQAEEARQAGDREQ